THARHAAAVHLPDSAPAESHAAGQGDPEGHLARLLPGREDRRARPERCGQMDAAQDHGGCRARLRGRRAARRGHPHRPPAAGAGARPGEERAPARRGGGGRDARAAHALRGALHEARRAAPRRRDGEGARRAGARAGRDRRRGRLGARPQARGGDGRAPPSAGRRLGREGKEAATRRRALAGELEWVRRAPRARQAKGKARLARYEELLAQDQAAEGREGVARISIPPGPRLGNLVIEAQGVRKAYGENLLMDEVGFILPRGGIVGVVGPNGAGKTTLFRMIVGEEKPDAGTLRIGETVVLAYVDQSRETLVGEHTVWEELSDGGRPLIMVGKREVNSRAYAAAFNFTGPDQQKKVKDLSGGERNRLHLAKLLRSGGNLLLLDEPTNDLDVDTLRALED